jgi:hypothetical protein
MRLRYAGTAPEKLQEQSCDADLWKHVDQSKRLRVVEACTAVEGRVTSLRRESDGDLHIALDPDQKSVLNLFHVAHAHRRLVLEIICEHTPADSADKTACGDFHPRS